MPSDKPIEVRAVVSFDDKTVADTQTEHTHTHATQESIRKAAWGAVVAASIYALITFAMWYQMMKQTKILQSQVEIIDRPWLTIDAKPCTVCGEGDIRGGPLTFDKDGHGSLTFTAIMTNIGKSPATNVRLRYKFLPVGLGDPKTNPITTPGREQKAFCSTKNTQTIDQNTIFPSPAPFVDVYGPAGFDTSQIPDNPMFSELKSGKPIMLFLIGCVDYEYSSSTKPHQTGFVFQIFAIKPDQGIQTTRSVPIDRLSFVPYTFSGGPPTY